MSDSLSLGSEELKNDALRAKAARRSWLCPGAGSALFGRKYLAVLNFVASLSSFAAIAMMAFQPNIRTLWTALGILALATLLWIVEQFVVKRVVPHPPGPRFLVAGFPFTVTGMMLVAGLTLAFILSNFGSMRMAGSGMSPTLEKGEFFLYHKRPDLERLRRGTVIAYKLSDQSAWGQRGFLVISRILAVPGDRLSIQGGNYLVNGNPGSSVGPTGEYAPVILVPQAPDAMQVPEHCYFIVQDSPSAGFDSRALFWVSRENVISSHLYYVRSGGILKEVE